jgi:hypothetical protein
MSNSLTLGVNLQDGFELPVPVVSAKAAISCQFRLLREGLKARLRRTGERLASDSAQSDVYVCPKKGAGRHETQLLKAEEQKPGGRTRRAPRTRLGEGKL